MNASNGAPGLVVFVDDAIDVAVVEEMDWIVVRVLVDIIRAHFLFQFFA